MKPLSILAVAVFLGAIPSGAGAQESLGDTARKVKPKDAQVTSKRVFTDDDVAHANPNQLQSSESSGDRIRDTQKLIDKLSGKTPRELSNGVVGEVQFTERDAWEARLVAKKERVLQSAQTAVDAASKINSGSTPAEKANARNAVNHILSDLDFEMTGYNRLVAEGIQKASDWERKTMNR